MGNFLQSTIGNNNPLFNNGLRSLEAASGNKGIDAKLVGDTLKHAHRVMRSIGLDPADTTARELYGALNSHRSTSHLFDETDYVVLMVGREAISFNSADILENSNRDFANRTIDGARHDLLKELLDRYKSAAITKNRIEKIIKDYKMSLSLLKPRYKKQNTKQSSGQVPRIMAIGDIVTDAFIKLREDQAEVTTDANGNERLSMPFGNKPPYDSVEIVKAVGNAANAAVAFSRLGLKGELMAWLGDDQAGKESLDYLAHERVDASSVVTSKGMKSNYHYVLRYGADRTILIKYEPYKYQWRDPAVVPDWIYLSAISEDTWQLHKDLMAYLKKHPEVKFAFQPGTFHFEWGKKKLKDLYAASDIVVMNREEAAVVIERSTRDIAELFAGLHELGPETVIITDGPNGSYASDSKTILQIPNYPDPAPPLDRTGAGDAFASTIVAALAMGETLESALMLAPINSMNVVQKLGAQEGLCDLKTLQKYLKKAPAHYKIKEYKK